MSKEISAADAAALGRLKRRMRQLLSKHALARVEMVVSDHFIVMRALPALYNPVVQQRRVDAFKGRESITIQEATEASEKAIAMPIATAKGTDISETLSNLEAELSRK